MKFAAPSDAFFKLKVWQAENNIKTNNSQILYTNFNFQSYICDVKWIQSQTTYCQEIVPYLTDDGCGNKAEIKYFKINWNSSKSNQIIVYAINEIRAKNSWKKTTSNLTNKKFFSSNLKFLLFSLNKIAIKINFHVKN